MEETKKEADPVPFSPNSAKQVEDFLNVDVPEVTEQKPALADDPTGID
jgi:hypothetical protein